MYNKELHKFQIAIIQAITNDDLSVHQDNIVDNLKSSLRHRGFSKRQIQRCYRKVRKKAFRDN